MPLNNILRQLAVFLAVITAVGCQSKKEILRANSMHNSAMDDKIPLGYSDVKIDPERIQLFGIQTQKVIFRDLNKSVRAVGIVDADERRVANIQTKFSGWIVDLYVNFTNKAVNKGDPLFSVYSPVLLSTQQEYIIAKKGLKNQIKGTFGEEYGRTNQRLLESVRQRLELWDVPLEEIDRLDRLDFPDKTITIRSPINGIVLRKNAFAGMNVEPGMNIFVVADLSHVWIMADIFEQDIASVKLKQKAVLTLTAFPGKRFDGKVNFINHVLEPATRTTKVRFDFDNSNMDLKPGMYGTVELSIPIGFVLCLPEASVIDTGTKKIVFIEKSPGFYRPVEVQLGPKGNGCYQVLKGLNENDAVVTSSQFLMDSESRIQATGTKTHGMEMNK